MNDNFKKYFWEYFDYPMTFVNQKIMELVNEFFDKIPEYFYTVPASSTGKYHPSFDHGEGGLLRHTQMTCEILMEFQRMDEYKHLNFFDMMVACILHDTFKNGYVDNNRTVASHASIAADEFYNTYVYHKYTQEDLEETIHNVTYNCAGELDRRVRDICNMIRTHMGQWGAVRPQTDAEKLVHLADYVVSRKCWDKFNED
jgi:hypothetical protein